MTDYLSRGEGFKGFRRGRLISIPPPTLHLFNNLFLTPPPSPTLPICHCGVKSSEWGLAGSGVGCFPSATFENKVCV